VSSRSLTDQKTVRRRAFNRSILSGPACLPVPGVPSALKDDERRSLQRHGFASWREK
jgi:hypothetical protein